MSLTIDTTIKHGRVVGKMVNYGFGMPTRLVADGDVARWCGRLVAHYGGTKALVVLGGDKHTRDELVSAALGSVDRALLDERVDFVLAIGDADTAGFARELARRMAALDAGEDGFVPYGCIVSEGKVPAVVGAGEVPVFVIIAPELLEGIGSPLRELLGSVCAAA